MNERHEQLMAQAWIEFAPDAKAVTKRFAELIVRECISKLDDIGVIDRDSRTIAMKVISEHFGVDYNPVEE
jgi:hypothetical protein